MFLGRSLDVPDTLLGLSGQSGLALGSSLDLFGSSLACFLAVRARRSIETQLQAQISAVFLRFFERPARSKHTFSQNSPLTPIPPSQQTFTPPSSDMLSPQTSYLGTSPSPGRLISAVVTSLQGTSQELQPEPSPQPFSSPRASNHHRIQSSPHHHLKC